MAIKFLSHPGKKMLVCVQEILTIKLLICYININMLNIIPNIIPKSKSQLFEGQETKQNSKNGCI